VIGIGLNLASAPDGTEYPATSLADAGITGITPKMAIEGFARYFDDWLRRWHCEGFAPVRAAWLAHAAGLGADIRVRFEHAELTGRFLDLDQDGALVLATGTAGARRVSAGEIFPAA